MAPSPSANPYISVPPPPLPEFYRKTTKQQLTSHTSDSAHSTVSSDGAHLRPRYSSHMSAPSATQSSAEVPPLAVYHICRICLRPRSARYHREHPIPIDGMPPPPGICRRCRVSSVDELRSNTGVIEHRESNNIRIGVASFVPDDDYLTNKEMKDIRASRTVRGNDLQISSAPAASVYKSERVDAYKAKTLPSAREEAAQRHTRMAAPLASAWRASPPAHSEPAEELHYNIRRTIDRTRSSREPDTYNIIAIPPPPPVFERGNRKIDASEVRKVETIASSDTTHTAGSQSSKSQVSSRESTNLGRTLEPARSESEIRRLAREEVVYYRQAERKLEAHKDPYAHGRMVEVERVPVQRRIDVEREVVQVKPWQTNTELSRKDSKCIQPSNPKDRRDDDLKWQEIGSASVKGYTPSTRPSRFPRREAEAEVTKFSSTKAPAETANRSEESSGRYHLQASPSVDELLDASRRKQGVGNRSQEAQDGSQQAESGKTERMTKTPVTLDREVAANVSPEQSDIGPEYIYTRRTVTPVGRRWEDQYAEAGHFYKSTEQFLRRDGSADRAGAGQERDLPRKLVEVRRRVSDASSRVHFSKKVDISPTPPDSEASSSDFRDFARLRTQYDGQSAKEVAEEYASRGRSRGATSTGERHRIQEPDRDATPRPRPLRNELPSRSSETADVSGGASSARMKDAPPQTERFHSYKPAKAESTDGLGPYSTFLYGGRRSPSLYVEDGSTQASSSNKSHREWQRRDRNTKSERH